MLFRLHSAHTVDFDFDFDDAISCVFYARLNDNIKFTVTITHKEFERIVDRNDITLSELFELKKQSPYTVHKCKTK